MRDYTKRGRLDDFPIEKIFEVGDSVETILLKEDASLQDIRLLEYLEAFLLFRENYGKKEEGFYEESLNKAKEDLAMSDEDFVALNLWARKMLDNENSPYHSPQIETLYERISKKLEIVKNPPTVKNTF